MKILDSFLSAKPVFDSANQKRIENAAAARVVRSTGLEAVRPKFSGVWVPGLAPSLWLLRRGVWVASNFTEQLHVKFFLKPAQYGLIISL